LRIIRLDKVLDSGTTYTLESDRAYLIEAIGTNSSGAAKIYIDEVPTGEFDSTVAPLHKTSSNLLGPLKLGDLFYVVPPDKKIRFEGDSGSKLRIIGKIALLDTGESIPSHWADRFKKQGDHYWTMKSGTISLATDEAWGDGQEYTAITLSPATIETYRLNNFIGVSMSGGTVSEGDFGIRFKWKDAPFDIHSTDEGPFGVDVLSAPLPPSVSNEMEPFSLEDLPFEVPGDTTFTIGIINTSGASKSPTSGSNWAVTVKAIVEFVRV